MMHAAATRSRPVPEHRLSPEAQLLLLLLENGSELVSLRQLARARLNENSFNREARVIGHCHIVHSEPPSPAVFEKEPTDVRTANKHA
jgi:hypothetical protein